jgi:hypothetical protein
MEGEHWIGGIAMTTIPEPEPFEAERICAVCGHNESDHVEEDVDGETKLRGRCIVCNDWHGFVPKPE